ncbi:MAG TPA: type IV secretory system conjugative DNA transfer family protein [Tepidisphaeraceae bacterium]|nr:type IV secretory system conjugative DNA transfer family protein [Tepidisphaeraceae bacterium]
MTNLSEVRMTARNPPSRPHPLYTVSAPFLGYGARKMAGFGLAAQADRENLAAGDQEPVLHTGNSHLLGIGATGSGKTNLLIANLLLYEGSAIVIDIRGDAVRATERFRRKVLKQDTYVLDPFKVTTRKSDRLDPLDIATLPNTEIESEAQSIGSTLTTDHRSSKDPYWHTQGGNLVASLVAHLLTQKDLEKRSMNYLMDILFSEDAVLELAKLLDTEVPKNSFAYLGIASFLQLPENTANTRFCVLSTAHSMLHAFRSSAIRATMGPSTVNLKDLMKGRPVTIYLVLPIERLSSHGVVLKLWLELLLQVLLRRTAIPAVPTMVLVDEAGQLGNSPAMRTVATFLRASGVRLWSMWQDLSQIQALYPIDWPTLINNTSALTFLPGTGLAARELAALAAVPMAAISNLAVDEQLVCETGHEPAVVKMAQYWKDPRFAGRFDLLPRYARTSPAAPGR